MADYPDFEGPKSGLYDIPHWAAKEATDKNLYGSETNADPLDFALIEYTIPEGKTLYISQLGCSQGAYAQASRDLNQMIYVKVHDTTDDEVLFIAGGNGGAVISFAKPISVAAEHDLQITAVNITNHNTNITVSAGGYEI